MSQQLLCWLRGNRCEFPWEQHPFCPDQENNSHHKHLNNTKRWQGVRKISKIYQQPLKESPASQWAGGWDSWSQGWGTKTMEKQGRGKNTIRELGKPRMLPLPTCFTHQYIFTPTHFYTWTQELWALWISRYTQVNTKAYNRCQQYML